MIFSLLSSGSNLTSILISLLLTIPIMLLALSLHETAHGYVAWRCGDNTAYNLGRLTLNPLRHLDPMGLICLLIFGFGWAKPVPINTRNFRNPKRGMALSALAGPVANLLLGLFCAVICGVCFGGYRYLSFQMLAGIGNTPRFAINLLYWLTLAMQYGALINFVYMIFNMIPVPPFDGSRILLAFLPPKAYFGLMRYERQIMYGLLIALFVLSYLGFSPFSFLAEKLTDAIVTPIAKAVVSALIK